MICHIKSALKLKTCLGSLSYYFVVNYIKIILRAKIEPRIMSARVQLCLDPPQRPCQPFLLIISLAHKIIVISCMLCYESSKLPFAKCCSTVVEEM